ncbi:hypothetical protein [Paenibacillus sp. GP183]|jgi:hypothetical protein|uniref:hypothetical protein n=1 Tax=Paenibacillus sp. GP183 TaxID=1882751 RepID=UPI0008943235|nr:hypothetical protein [Paenibacillus sp. GP183]SEB42609.1 hypothetical protein SAMN05443246_0232 [Paenibacillus sp. GP183]
MQIKKKVDIEDLLENFSSNADWDASGEKHYIVFTDHKRNGQWTLMNYPDNRFSIHSRGENYSDEDETFFDDRDQLVSFIWDNRSAFNAALKTKTLAGQY